MRWRHLCCCFAVSRLLAFVLSELLAQFSDQLGSLGFGPAGEPRPHPFGGRDRLALPQNLVCFIIAKLLDLLDRPVGGDLRTRVRVNTAIVTFAKDLIAKLLAEDVRREVVRRSALDQYYANSGDGGSGHEPPPVTA